MAGSVINYYICHCSVVGIVLGGGEKLDPNYKASLVFIRKVMHSIKYCFILVESLI